MVLILGKLQLYLYIQHYVNNISKLLDFPVDVNNDKIGEILATDANSKYIRDIEIQELDKYVRKVSFIK